MGERARGYTGGWASWWTGGRLSGRANARWRAGKQMGLRGWVVASGCANGEVEGFWWAGGCVVVGERAGGQARAHERASGLARARGGRAGERGSLSGSFLAFHILVHHTQHTAAGGEPLDLPFMVR